MSNSSINGAISGCLSTVALQPLDVIKTRMQLTSMNLFVELCDLVGLIPLLLLFVVRNRWVLEVMLVDCIRDMVHGDCGVEQRLR